MPKQSRVAAGTSVGAVLPARWCQSPGSKSTESSISWIDGSASADTRCCGEKKERRSGRRR